MALEPRPMMLLKIRGTSKRLLNFTELKELPIKLTVTGQADDHLRGLVILTPVLVTLLSPPDDF